MKKRDILVLTVAGIIAAAAGGRGHPPAGDPPRQPERSPGLPAGRTDRQPGDPSERAIMGPFGVRTAEPSGAASRGAPARSWSRHDATHDPTAASTG